MVLKSYGIHLKLFGYSKYLSSRLGMAHRYYRNIPIVHPHLSCPKYIKSTRARDVSVSKNAYCKKNVGQRNGDVDDEETRCRL